MIRRALSQVLVLSVAWFAAELQAAPLNPPGWAIATAHPLATAAGREIATNGGNAFDAAIAVSAALAVVEPMGSGLGGGGFWLLHRARDGMRVMVDGRERAPLTATRDMYLSADGQPVPKASLDGPLAAAIPGAPAALVHLSKRYGRLPLLSALAPAVRYAERGFRVTPRFRRLLEFRHKSMNPSAATVFVPGGELPQLDDWIRQPQLAATLRALADSGRAGFYEGRIAKRLVTGVRAAGGIWSRQDLIDYRVVERAPIRGTYQGTRVISAAPPSSGGIVLVNALNILERWPLSELTPLVRTHRIVEAMRLAYRDRAWYLGDPDFVNVDSARLTSKAYARVQANTVTDQAATSDALELDRPEGQDTTHFSILDAEGNRVAATLSINYPFGSGFMPPGTGVLLNNEMDDFVTKPGIGNVYGLVGDRANAIEPGKRPLSSMSPTFIESDDYAAVLGTPGGSRIISMVLLAVLDLVHGNRDLQALMNRPRFHHQYLPDRLTFEEQAFSASQRDDLATRGHTLNPRQRPYGNMQAVLWDLGSNRLHAASDQRGEGAAQVFSLEGEGVGAAKEKD